MGDVSQRERDGSRSDPGHHDPYDPIDRLFHSTNMRQPLARASSITGESWPNFPCPRFNACQSVAEPHFLCLNSRRCVCVCGVWVCLEQAGPRRSCPTARIRRSISWWSTALAGLAPPTARPTSCGQTHHRSDVQPGPRGRLHGDEPELPHHLTAWAASVGRRAPLFPRSAAASPAVQKNSA